MSDINFSRIYVPANRFCSCRFLMWYSCSEVCTTSLLDTESSIVLHLYSFPCVARLVIMTVNNLPAAGLQTSQSNQPGSALGTCLHHRCWADWNETKVMFIASTRISVRPEPILVLSFEKVSESYRLVHQVLCWTGRVRASHLTYINYKNHRGSFSWGLFLLVLSFEIFNVVSQLE
jgi:hypothetical protein